MGKRERIRGGGAGGRENGVGKRIERESERGRGWGEREGGGG